MEFRRRSCHIALDWARRRGAAALVALAVPAVGAGSVVVVGNHHY